MAFAQGGCLPLSVCLSAGFGTSGFALWESFSSAEKDYGGAMEVLWRCYGVLSGTMPCPTPAFLHLTSQFPVFLIAAIVVIVANGVSVRCCGGSRIGG